MCTLSLVHTCHLPDTTSVKLLTSSVGSLWSKSGLLIGISDLFESEAVDSTQLQPMAERDDGGARGEHLRVADTVVFGNGGPDIDPSILGWTETETETQTPHAAHVTSVIPLADIDGQNSSETSTRRPAAPGLSTLNCQPRPLGGAHELDEDKYLVPRPNWQHLGA
jgi:hypothetical protein